MKVVQIIDGRIQARYNYKSAAEARLHFAKNIIFMDVPDHVGQDWIVDMSQGEPRFIAPQLDEGWYWDENGNPWNAEASRSTERQELLDRADRDVLEAYRMQRSKDTSIDWSAWIDALEDFAEAVKATVDQSGYPEKVDYPEYPQKPQ